MNIHRKLSKFVPSIKIVGVCALLMLLLAQMLLSSRQKSAAFDETFHLISGYSYLTTHDPRLQWEHPPLAQVVAASALWGQGLTPIQTDNHAWQTGDAEHFVDQYLWVENASLAANMIWRGRIPLILLTALFGLALFFALRDLVSESAAWVGLTLFAFDPNIITNGRLITTDMAVSGLMLVAVWRLAIYLRQPNWLNLIFTGVATGLAFSSKLTAVLLIPSFLAIVLVYRLPAQKWGKVIGRRLMALVGIGVIALVTLWGVYGFEFGQISPNLPPLPAPTFFGGIPHVLNRVSDGTPTFLLGQTDDNGWWYYFPLTFLLKTPLPLLILLIVAISQRRWRETIIWWFPALLILIVAVNSTLQIGYRHIMPMLVFALAWAASSVDSWPKLRWRQVALGSLTAWLVISALMTFPNHMSFSNLLAGGTRNTWRVFADMNVDWGQDLPALANYMQEHPDEHLYLSYFGSAFPAAYGVDATMLPSFARILSGPIYSSFNAQTPPPGTYAISATMLRLGLLHEGRDLFAFFRERQPDEMAGGSILLYRVEEDNRPIQRTVVNSGVVWRLSAAELNLDANERLIAKWAGNGATILPMGGESHYIVKGKLPSHPIVQQAIDSGDARLVYDQIPFQLVTLPVGATSAEKMVDVAQFDNGLQLIGWDTNALTYQAGELVIITTFWQVNALWRDEFKLFLHIIDTAGVPLAQWDGWSVAAAGLEIGDLIVVEHPIWLPPELTVGEYQLQAGFYRPNTGMRVEVSGSDRVYLMRVRVDE